MTLSTRTMRSGHESFASIEQIWGRFAATLPSVRATRMRRRWQPGFSLVTETWPIGSRRATVMFGQAATWAPVYVNGAPGLAATELGFRDVKDFVLGMIDAFKEAAEPEIGHMLLDLSQVRVYVGTAGVAAGIQGGLGRYVFHVLARTIAPPAIPSRAARSRSFDELAMALAEELPAVEVPSVSMPSATENPAHDLKEWSGLPVKDLAILAKVSQRSFFQWLKGGVVSESHKGDLLRLRAVVAILASMLRPAEVARWFKAPIRDYGQKSPAELWREGNEEAVRRLVGRYLDSIVT